MALLQERDLKLLVIASSRAKWRRQVESIYRRAVESGVTKISFRAAVPQVSTESLGALPYLKDLDLVDLGLLLCV